MALLRSLEILWLWGSTEMPRLTALRLCRDTAWARQRLEMSERLLTGLLPKAEKGKDGTEGGWMRLDSSTNSVCSQLLRLAGGPA